MPRASVAVAVACLAALAWPATAFWCHSDVYLGPTVATSQKGLALDDTTFWGCPEKVPAVWPNALDVVSSLRLFKAWDASWPEHDRAAAWQKLRRHTRVNDAGVLVGTQITCAPDVDEQDWSWTKELLAFLGPEHVMGLAIGNEMDLLFSKSGVDEVVTPDCIRELWSGGRFWHMFASRVAELDAMGFGGITVTTVFGGLALEGEPFKENPAEALVASFLRNATNQLGSRYAFTFNFYPYFDPTLELDPNSSGSCQQALSVATCFQEACSIPKIASRARRKIQQLTGSPNSTFWIGETGWSAPLSGSLNTPLARCAQWSSSETLEEFYRNFLAWNMSIDPELQPPSRAFYFTARDSVNYGVPESFGLIRTCEDFICKLSSPDFMAPEEIPEVDLAWTRWVFLALAVLVLLAASASAIWLRLQEWSAETLGDNTKEQTAMEPGRGCARIQFLARRSASKGSSSGSGSTHATGLGSLGTSSSSTVIESPPT